MPFQVTGISTIKHLNIRRGTSDDATVSIDIKFEMEDVPVAAAAAALGAESPADVELALFRPVSIDAERNARFMGVKYIRCSASWEEKHALTIKGLRTVRASRVGKIEINPRHAGRFDAVFTVSIERPPQGYVELLAEMLSGRADITLEHDAELDFPKTPGSVGTVRGIKGRRDLQ